MFLRLPTSVSAGETVEMFYRGMSRNLVVLTRQGDRSSAWVVDSFSGKVKEKLLAENPMQAGLVDRKVWLLDSDGAWKRYSTA